VDIQTIMDTSVHFENISDEISKYLREADNDIVIAIAWFTDASLFNILRNKASTGVKIKLLYLDDDINKNSSFNIKQLEEYKTKTQLFPITQDLHPNNIMHNKFCVIDGKHAITGSYNWTYRAKSNDENIIVFSDNTEFASRYLKEFDNLLEKYHFKKSVNKSPQAIIPRLEVIKNFVLMEEWESVQGQVEKLRSFTEIWDLDPLLRAIKNQDSQTTTNWISVFIRDKSSIVIHEDENIVELKIELRMFEYKVVALSTEKNELEKQIEGFHQNTNQKLGGLISRFLELQAKKKQKEADKAKTEQGKEERTKKKRLEEEAEEAQKEWKEYTEDYEDFKKKPQLRTLSTDERKQIKDTFRKAAQLCHPDKVSEDQREIAEKRFIQLKTAYDHNDLETVLKIHDDLINNRPYTDNADSLSDAQLIKQEISRLKGTSDDLLVEVLGLKKQVGDLGIDSIIDWDEYFVQQKQSLEEAIEQLVKELKQVEVTDKKLPNFDDDIPF
jgi:hypothetical protein